ncbi:MAG: MBL fold metallo-hydrolase [bacterium]|nr:MBL fold metallo-hydrolase [bacterium]
MLTFTNLTNKVYLAVSDAPVVWKCNGLVIIGNTSTVLIDCNFSAPEIDQIYDLVKEHGNSNINTYFVTHMHVDHANNLHNWESRDVQLLCPRPEDSFVKDSSKLLQGSGSFDFNAQDAMKDFIHNYQGFKEVRTIEGFDPGDGFVFNDISIQTLHLPGHSPGHSGFVINTGAGERKILFVSDLGLDRFGVWYGFKYCTLKDIRESVNKVKDLYNSDDFILAGSHCDPFFEKQDDSIFPDILDKIDKTRALVLKELESRGTVKLSDITLTGLYYKAGSIKKMNPFIRNLYFFWEYFTLKNHFIEMEEEGLVFKIGGEIDEEEWGLKQPELLPQIQEVSEIDICC